MSHFRLADTPDTTPGHRCPGPTEGEIIFQVITFYHLMSWDISRITKNAMAKTIRKQRRRGRPATGQDKVTAVRLPAGILQGLDVWLPLFLEAQNRSDVIRFLVAKGLNNAIERQQRFASANASDTLERITGGEFTAESEQAFTAAIKQRMLFEGAIDLPWDEYAAWRKTHKGCEPLTDADQTYVATFASCAVR
jgi:hypothetical protein